MGLRNYEEGHVRGCVAVVEGGGGGVGEVSCHK